MLFIDTHTHLFSPSFDEDRTETVQRAIHAGVEVMLLPNIDVESIEPMYDLCTQFPDNCFPMMGLHPGSVGENWESDLEIIRKNLFERKNVAVGEIGMDLYWDKTFKDQQAEALGLQLTWAKELSLPVVIHARETFDEIFEVVDELNDESLTGVFHCFTGTVDQAKKIAEYGGFKLGIGGVLTYKKSGLDEVIKEIPMDMLILETDSPYLPPTPHRGKRNESSYLLHIAEKLADVKGMTLKEVAEITTANAKNLFKLK
jgi:TatD DNase family protein